MKHNPEDHLRLVGKIAARFAKGNRMEYQDIFQEGCVGLIRACNEYEEGDVPFGAFAGMHIQFAILNALGTSNFIKMDKATVWVASKIKKNEMMEMPAQEIAKELGKSLKVVERALDHLNFDVMSLDFEYYARNNVVTILDICKYEVPYTDGIFIEEILDDYGMTERDKEIARLVMDGHSLSEATRMLGEDYRAASGRIRRRRDRLQNAKHLITE